MVNFFLTATPAFPPKTKIMASITTTVTVITEMVRGRMVAVPIEPIVCHPTLPAVRMLVE